MTVITRFAPSPTGYLHIGGARTALFNYLFSKKNNGKFLLRIEDTDKKRSTQEAVDAIINGMKWLGLNHDDNIFLQSKNEKRHAEVAHQLLEKGMAYKCYCTTEELDEMRKLAEAEGRGFKYPKIWRDKSETEAPSDIKPSIRIKAPLTGEVKINDLVQGEVTYPAEDIDDMVILRADGTPTYLLAAVVDDHDMGITHIIRGDDHLTNAFRQKVIFEAMGWKMPETAHIPLIHGADGAKLSKRHGALAVEVYRDELGYINEAIVNYLMGLAWNYGDEDKISLADAIAKFEITSVGRSPSRFDFAKLNSLNFLYLRDEENNTTLENLKPFLIKKYGEVSNDKLGAILKLLTALKERASNYVELADKCEFIIHRLEYNTKAKEQLDKGKDNLSKLIERFDSLNEWNSNKIKEVFDNFGTENNIKAGAYMPAFRVAVCGTMEAPSLIEVMEALGKNEVLKRVNNI
ncbi:MAG TPA: glutamate--tRNA ligase [Alphaproteobacteria bacterium]|nr:glutamate--tRNA ligase [Alphaproteobacteria bacterium]